MVYLYILLLLLSVLLIFSAANKCRRCPPKIGLLSIVVLILLLCRYFSLLIMYICKNINYMYILRPFYFIYVICIPICGLIMIYILMRNDKLNFMYILVISMVIIATYEILISKIPINISLYDDYGFGYVMKLTKFSFYIDVFTLVVNVIFLTLAIRLLNRKNTFAISLMVLAALVSIIGVIIPYLGVYVTPQCIFGEVFWIITLNYCLEKLRKRTELRN